MINGNHGYLQELAKDREGDFLRQAEQERLIRQIALSSKPRLAERLLSFTAIVSSISGQRGAHRHQRQENCTHAVTNCCT